MIGSTPAQATRLKLLCFASEVGVVIDRSAGNEILIAELAAAVPIGDMLERLDVVASRCRSVRHLRAPRGGLAPRVDMHVARVVAEPPKLTRAPHLDRERS